MSEKIFEVIGSKKDLLNDLTETELMNISVVPLPESTNGLQDALSSVLENIALFGDMVLNLPDITHRILKKHPEYQSTIRWSFEFLNRTKDYLDETTLRMIDLAAQELNITERDPNYSNPNTLANIKKSNTENTKKSSIRRREKLKRGPRVTNTEL
ncbi:hypothetical protein QAD02_005208 [Eretmocerus hayati]|uniref:Uncharacterized protein n=1 Tax=Eretmocerus hayati TaxID=131215 RepID=A0ACC2NTL4_9HYME|nr:hypothetical protein QAD02_005208 [Eretmocerus hayati]